MTRSYPAAVGDTTRRSRQIFGVKKPKVGNSRCRTWVAMQLICPCLIGRKDLMTRSYPAAVGDTTRRSRQIFGVKKPKVQSGSHARQQQPQLTPPVGWTGGGGLVQKASNSRCRTRVAMQLICPCLIGRKDLMTRSYPAAVGDTTRRSRQIFGVKKPKVQSGSHARQQQPQLTPPVGWTGGGGLVQKVGSPVGWTGGGGLVQKVGPPRKYLEPQN